MMKFLFPLRTSFKRWLILLCVATMLPIVTLFPSVSRADNPIVQTIYTADPAALVHNGRVYLYTGHDEDGSTFFTMNEWRAGASSAPGNLADHGSPRDINIFTWVVGGEWAGPPLHRHSRVL